MDGQPILFLHLIWVIPLVFLIAYIGSPRSRGTIGESQVGRNLLANLQKNQYTVFNDLKIPSGGGTIQIDHLVVSQFGIFVIETVYKKGTISGTASQDRWKQYRFGRFTLFDNPLQQNYLAIKSLEVLLHLPHSHFHSIVVLTGINSFRQKMPEQVIPVEKLIPVIRKHNRKLLLPDTANRVLGQISDARLNSHGRNLFNSWSLFRLMLIVVLLAGSWFAFSGEFKKLNKLMQEQLERKSAPEKFHADGRRKSSQELWEDALRCAYSADTGRCACYEPDGSKIDLGPEKCQSLSERGSILKR